MTGPGVDVAKHEALRLVGQFTDFIGLCACGTPEAFLRQIQSGLEAYAPAGQNRAASLFDPVTEVADMMVMYLLDCWNLTEHGTSISGGWLTRAGVRLRDAMRQVDLFDGSSDIDGLHCGGWWWTQEHQLHPAGRDGTGVVSMGSWDDHDDD